MAALDERVDFGGLVTVTVTRSELDGTVLVLVDTPNLPEDEHGPRLRIWLNDDTVWENPRLFAGG